ncbi:DNA repair protein RadC [Paenibacillus oenotherae]|uniref:DNA repair protein RadC n=1 Tax=Paenibacillus oenotherae TaxID=1435645 RepID=A0ABS7DA55_9BACL|nr:DNA repair protein RadC [Paenibacillus oenotherae]MBW7476679.1 DNA repair protein RadC [Paenibacillus oenotherae]
MIIAKKQTYKQLLASTLRENADSYLINELIDRYPNPVSLVDVTEQELLNIKGIGVSKAKQIVAAVQLVQEFTAPSPEPIIIRSPSDVFSLMEFDMRYASKELFVCLFLNTKNHIIAKEVISIGTLNATLVHPREVFRAAIKRNSASVICCHNHPSGNPEPSPEDIQITKQLVSVGQLIGIEVLDHVIIAGHSYVSIREKGLMDIEKV